MFSRIQRTHVQLLSLLLMGAGFLFISDSDYFSIGDVGVAAAGDNDSHTSMLKALGPGVTFNEK